MAILAQVVVGVLSCSPVMYRCVRIPSALGFVSRVSSRLLLSRSQSVTKELSGGWYQVLNKGEEYFWHKPSNQTSWTLPADIPSQTAPAVHSAELEYLLKTHGHHAAQLVVAAIKCRYKAGETLNTADFDLLHGVYSYHPDYARKLGVGVRSIKVDVAPTLADEKTRSCFWFVRTDGSTTDVSLRRCWRALSDRTK